MELGKQKICAQALWMLLCRRSSGADLLVTPEVGILNNSICDDILSPLKHLRKERQAPAHKIQLDDYANEYLSKQHSLCKSIYRSLHLLRCLLQTHPKLKNTKIRYSKTDYIEL